MQLPNIFYRKEPAEHSSIADHSVDLITVAQAIHWFHFDEFYKEVRRVAKPGAVIAAFSYAMFRAEDRLIDKIIQDFYSDSAPYWDPERSYVDAHYRIIPFPFDEIEAPLFYINYEWNIGQMIGYMRTWSANQHYRKEFGTDLVSEEFKNTLSAHWPGTEKIKLGFPVFMRLGKV